MKGLIYSIGLIVGLFCVNGLAAEWQWSVPLKSVVSSETNENPRAFLWIPPDCNNVKAVIVGQHNMLEEPLFEYHQFRQKLAKLCVAEVWISPIFDFVFRFDEGAGEKFTEMMNSLAEESGYQELKNAPIIPIGHSALASFPWNFAAWNPERTLAIISLKGDAAQTNLTGSGKPNPDWQNHNIDGIPALMIMGEYEWWVDRLTPMFPFKKKYPNTTIAVLPDVGRGHFDISDNLVNFLGMFIEKSVKNRLGNDGKLKPIDPKKGWLVDIWDKKTGRKLKADSYDKYKGNRDLAFWAFDREMALATENYNANHFGNMPQLLGFIQNGKLIEQNPKTHAQVNLSLPKLDENLTFKLVPTFLETVPEGNPEKWSELSKGQQINHPKDVSKIKISRITGPIVQIAPDTFAIRFNRMGLNNQKRTGDIWFLAEHSGDEKFKSAVQQANLRIPIKNTEGAEQKLIFENIPNQKRGIKRLKLHAASTANVPVFFYVREANAVVVGNELVFTKLPKRAKLPLKITVVAWQYGSYSEPKLKTAEPIEQTFLIEK